MAHTRPVGVLDLVVPLLFVAFAAVLVVGAARGRPATVWDVSRPYLWLVIAVWLVLAGDAAFGDDRPVFERTWKGTVAALLTVGFALDRWRRHRRPHATHPDQLEWPGQPDRPDRPERRSEQVDG